MGDDGRPSRNGRTRTMEEKTVRSCKLTGKARETAGRFGGQGTQHSKLTFQSAFICGYIECFLARDGNQRTR